MNKKYNKLYNQNSRIITMMKQEKSTEIEQFFMKEKNHGKFVILFNIEDVFTKQRVKRILEETYSVEILEKPRKEIFNFLLQSKNIDVIMLHIQTKKMFDAFALFCREKNIQIPTLLILDYNLHRTIHPLPHCKMIVQPNFFGILEFLEKYSVPKNLSVNNTYISLQNINFEDDFSLPYKELQEKNEYDIRTVNELEEEIEEINELEDGSWETEEIPRNSISEALDKGWYEQKEVSNTKPRLKNYHGLENLFKKDDIEKYQNRGIPELLANVSGGAIPHEESVLKIISNKKGEEIFLNEGIKEILSHYFGQYSFQTPYFKNINGSNSSTDKVRKDYEELLTDNKIKEPTPVPLPQKKVDKKQYVDQSKDLSSIWSVSDFNIKDIL